MQRRVAASLVGKDELSTGAARMGGGDLLEFGVRGKALTFDVPVRPIKHKRLVRAHLVARLVVVHHLGPHRPTVFVADNDDGTAGFHIAGAPVMRSLPRGQRRRRLSRYVVERHVHIAQLGALGVGEEVRGIGAHPRPQDAGLRDVVAHPEQHLVRAVENGLRGRDRSSALTPPRKHKEQQRQTLHTAPAFIKSCRCTIPTTFLSPSSTGRAMMPWRSMRLTAALASSSAVVALGVLVMTSPTGMSRNLSVRSMSRVRSPAVTTPASVALPFASTTATVPRFSASSTTHSRIGRSGVRIGRSCVSITSATRSNSLRPSTPPGCRAAKSSRRKPLTSSSVTATGWRMKPWCWTARSCSSTSPANA